MKLDTQMRDYAFGAIGGEAQRFERMGFDTLLQRKRRSAWPAVWTQRTIWSGWTWR